MILFVDYLIRMGSAFLAGALIGLERQCRQRKGSTANSGVPIYTIRKSSFFIIISFNLPRNVPIPDGTS